MTKEHHVLPCGEPIYKMMYYHVTEEKCQVIKVNEPDPLTGDYTVTVTIIRKYLGIPTVTYLTDNAKHFTVWNEKRNRTTEVSFWTKKGLRTVRHYSDI